MADSSVASNARLDVTAGEIEQLMIHRWGVAMSVKRLNHLLFWVKPLLDAEFQKMLRMKHSIEESTVRHLESMDRGLWTIS